MLGLAKVSLFDRFTRIIDRCFSTRHPLFTLFFVTLLVRVASFFVEYYYPDIIVSVLYRNGLNGGWEPIPHKGIMYTAFLDLSFAIFGMKANALHIMAFFLTYLEGLGVFFLSHALGYGKKTSYTAAFLFVVLTSTALPEIMVPNGEQVFMLFFIWGFFCFVRAYFDRKYWYYLGVLFFTILSLASKQTGMWFPLTLLFCLYIDIVKRIFKRRSRVILSVFLAFVVGIIVGVGVLIYANTHRDIVALQWLSNAWDYIRSYPKFNVMKWVAIFFLVFCHPLLLFFPIGNFAAQLKRNDFTRKDLFLYGVAFALFLSAFAGGTRLYQHYFFPLYPILSIFCASFIHRYRDFGDQMIRKVGGVSVIHIMVLFGLYIGWALMVNPLRPLYYKYPEFTPNSYSIYLYPNKMERETIAFLEEKKKENPDLEVYIWPVGHVMGYFSKLPFKIGTYIDVADNRCLLYLSVEECAKQRVDSFFQLNKKGDIFIEYRGILDSSTFSSNPIKAAIQKSVSSHQGLFENTEVFAKAIDKEMERRGSKKIFSVGEAMYLWEKP